MGFTDRTIAEHLNCSFQDISPRSQPDGGLKKMSRPRKIIPEISSFIEILSCLEASLINREILTRVEARWPTVTLSESLISHERIKFGFQWRPPLVKQDLSVMQQHQRFQFALISLKSGLTQIGSFFQMGPALPSEMIMDGDIYAMGTGMRLLS
jgi:hypothetical protein